MERLAAASAVPGDVSWSVRPVSMIHRLEIENFYSIRGRQVIELGVDGGAPDEFRRLAPLWRGAGRSGPKVVALFGANASGKSNVLKALAFLIWFVKDSFLAPRDNRLPFDRFNEATMLRSPTRLAIALGGLEDPAQSDDPHAPQCRYEYEIAFGGGANPVVTYESLSLWPGGDGRRVRLFERDDAGKISAARRFGLKDFRQVLSKILRPQASVISTLAQIEHPCSRTIWNLASAASYNLLIWMQEPELNQVIQIYQDNPGLMEQLNRKIERIDLGIRSMMLRQGSNGPLAFFDHFGMPEAMPLLYESEGTRQFIRLFPRLAGALQTGGLVVVDELDSAIHPLVLPEVLRWFRDPDQNPRAAQLWMTCQHATLLDDLSKEEVLFCEKDRTGATEVYGLGSIDAVKPGDDYYRGYIGGAFGALPRIG